MKAKARKGDETNELLLKQVNYALFHLGLGGKHDAKPSYEEPRHWLNKGQVDVVKVST